jgi:TPR repeat protein
MVFLIVVCLIVGIFFVIGFLGIRETNKKIAKLTEAAEKGGAEQQYELGMFLLCNNKPSEASPWFQKAKDQGYVKAEPRLYVCNLAVVNGFKTKGPYSYISKISAEGGDAVSQYLLGNTYEYCYELGDDRKTIQVYDIEPDLVQAVYWYKKSADQGHPLGQCELGECYLYGKGVEKDEQLGYRLLLKAAEGDSPAARQGARQTIARTSGMSYEEFVLKHT